MEPWLNRERRHRSHAELAAWISSRQVQGARPAYHVVVKRLTGSADLLIDRIDRWKKAANRAIHGTPGIAITTPT
jgi:hypothetical protein